MLNKKQLLAIIIKQSLIILVMVPLAITSVWYSTKQMTAISHSIKEKKHISYILSTRSETYERLRADFAKTGNAEEKINSALISADDISPFLAALDTLALQSGTTQTYHFGVPDAGAGSGSKMESVDYGLTIHANASETIAYLKNFERMPYFSGINSIALSSAGQNGINDQSSVVLSAKLYVHHQ